MADRGTGSNSKSAESVKRIESRKANQLAKRAARGNRDLTDRERANIATLHNVRNFIDVAIDDIEHGKAIPTEFMGAAFALGQSFQVDLQ